MDEPTAVLTPQEAEALFGTLRAMADEGKTVIFISHKLYEVKAVADRVTVLRGGRTVATVDAATVDAAVSRGADGRAGDRGRASRSSTRGSSRTSGPSRWRGSRSLAIAARSP